MQSDFFSSLLIYHLLPSKLVTVLSCYYCERNYIRKMKHIRKMKNLRDMMAGTVVRDKVLKAGSCFTCRTPLCSAFSQHCMLFACFWCYVYCWDEWGLLHNVYSFLTYKCLCISFHDKLEHVWMTQNHFFFRIYLYIFPYVSVAASVLVREPFL